MLVFPIRCQRLGQCPHNVRLLDDRRRRPSARVMLHIFIFLCFFFAFWDTVVHHSGHREPGLYACWDLAYLLITLGDLLVGASSECQIWRTPIQRENVAAINVPIIVDVVVVHLVQICLCLAEVRRCTPEGSGTMVRWGRMADREVQRGDGN